MPAPSSATTFAFLPFGIISSWDEARTVIHHERKSDGRIETGIVRSGTLAMDPPGIAVEVEGFFAG